MHRFTPAILGATLLTTALTGQSLGQLRDEIRRLAEESRYAVTIATLGDIAVDGELSGGSLDIEGSPGVSLTFFSLPWRNELDAETSGVHLRLEGTLGYSTARIDIPDFWSGQLPGLQTRVTTNYRTFGCDGGAGPSIPLGAGLRLEPLGHAGLAYVENETRYTGPGAALTRALADGILFNWDGVYATYGGSIALRRAELPWGEVVMQPVVRYDLRVTEGIAVDDPALDGGDTTQWFTARFDLRGPTGWRVLDRDLTWHADLGYRWWIGTAGDVFGFDNYFEVGGGLSWDAKDLLPGTSSLRIGGALLLAHDAWGWSLGASVDF